MTDRSGMRVERWTTGSRATVAAVVVIAIALAFAPNALGAGAVDRLTALFIYVILAAMWNALAGFGGLVSVGQQMFFGLGAYFAVRLADAGLNPFVALPVSALIVGVISLPVSVLMADRRALIYWCALVSMLVLLGALFWLLRSRVGAAIQAIRDNEDAAASVGVRVIAIKRLLFVLAAVGVGMAGALWLTTAVTFQPKTYFSVQWTAYMIFMVLVGGIGTFEGAILGAIIFFVIETWFGGTGVWYLVGLGVIAVLFSLLLPRGIWGEIERRWGISLLPVGYRVTMLDASKSKQPGTEP